MELVVSERLPVDTCGFFELKKDFFVKDFESLVHRDPVPLSTIVIILIVIIMVVLCI